MCYSCIVFSLYLQFLAVEIILRTYKTQTKFESGLYFIIKRLKILRLKRRHATLEDAVFTESVDCVQVPP